MIYLDSILDPGKIQRVVVVDDHYPLIGVPLFSNPSAVIEEMCASYGFTYLDSGKNLGMHGAINFALKEVKAKPEDVVILSDPDDFAVKGSYTALTDMIHRNNWIAVAALGFKCVEGNRSKLNPVPPTLFDELFKVNYWIHPAVDCWHIAAYRMEWINSIGGFGQVYPYWGGLESYLYEKWKRQNLKLIYLQDYVCDLISFDRNDPELFDPQFNQFKSAVHTTQYKGSFEAWLKRPC